MKNANIVVYYWVGGTDRGRWNEATPEGKTAKELVDELRKMGYYAVTGWSSIGAPEGPPAGLANFLHDMSGQPVDVCHETAYGQTTRLPFMVRVF